MISKAQLYMSKALRVLCKNYDVELMEEVVDGDMRYDFYIPTNPPILIEVDGVQHNLRKADGHFFKTGDDLENYLKNDFERKRRADHGRVILFNFTTEEFPSVEELEKKLKQHLIGGNDENDKFLKKLRRTKEYTKFKKNKEAESRKTFKEKCSAWDRPKRKLPGIRGME
ncbi:MAG: hypothetical protein ACRC0G_09090 [Fusobacteriaceae bacterium]